MAQMSQPELRWKNCFIVGRRADFCPETVGQTGDVQRAILDAPSLP